MEQKKERTADQKRQRKALLIMGAILLGLLVIGGIVTIVKQQKQLKSVQDLTQLEKEMLQDEYNELALQYEGYRFEISNDSLAKQLATEQAKVQRLMEELKTVKSTNATRIAELKRELETLRKVLRSYVTQIDSLNSANAALRTENQEVKRQITEVTTERQQLRAEREKLEQKVTLAAKLSTSGFNAQGLNSRGRKTTKIQQIKQLQFSFNIDSNVTAEPGFKDIFMRITTPEGQLLEQSGASGSFSFEGANVPYSISRQIEYGGEQTSLTMYWDVQEYLPEGSYQAEIFAEGYLIGRYSFTL